jgi:hypothetical protein
MKKILIALLILSSCKEEEFKGEIVEIEPLNVDSIFREDRRRDSAAFKRLFEKVDVLTKNHMFYKLAMENNEKYLMTGNEKYKRLSDKYADSCNYYNELLKAK